VRFSSGVNYRILGVFKKQTIVVVYFYSAFFALVFCVLFFFPGCISLEVFDSLHNIHDFLLGVFA